MSGRGRGRRGLDRGRAHRSVGRGTRGRRALLRKLLGLVSAGRERLPRLVLPRLRLRLGLGRRRGEVVTAGGAGALLAEPRQNAILVEGVETRQLHGALAWLEVLQADCAALAARGRHLRQRVDDGLGSGPLLRGRRLRVEDFGGQRGQERRLLVHGRAAAEREGSGEVQHEPGEAVPVRAWQ